MAEHEADVLRRLVQFLLEHGYPARSIVSEHRIGDFRPDIVVLEPSSGKPLAIFELKMRGQHLLESAARQLAAYGAAAGPDVALFAVMPTEDGQDLRVFRWQAGPKEHFEEASVPDFALLANKFLIEAVKKNRETRKTTTRSLGVTSWLLAALVGLLLLLKKLGTIELDPTDLALLGVFVGLVILPFAGRLKVLGFEYEALRSETAK